jgi:hypothetical protein
MMRVMLLVVFQLFLTVMSAQYVEEDIDRHPVEGEVWERATKGLDYPLDPERKSSKDRGLSLPGGIDISLGRLLMEVLMGLMLLTGIYMVLRGWLFKPVNRRIKGGSSIGLSLEEIEDQFQDISLEGYIRAAEQSGDYRLAVRLYYLAVLKALTAGSYIRWSREKTNGVYCSELKESGFRGRFEVLTAAFERVWYGEGGVDRLEYEGISAGMEELIRDCRR